MLKDLEAGIMRYKKIVAEQAIQTTIMKDVIEKALMPAEKYELVRYEQDTYKVSLWQALMWFNIRPSFYHYKPHPEQYQDVRDKFSELASLNNLWSFWGCITIAEFEVSLES